MTETKPKRSRKLTGVFPGLWCWLLTPNTKFSEEGEYSVDLVMSIDEARDLCKSVGQDVTDQAITIRQKNSAVKDWKIAWPVKDYDGDDETLKGKKLVNFQQKIKTGYNFRVDVFDSHKQQIEPESGLRIGNGTTMRVCFNVRVVEDSLNKCLRVKFHPVAVQIMALVPWETDYGFEEADGFTVGANGEKKTLASMCPQNDDVIDPFGGEAAGEGIPESDIPFAPNLY